MKYPYLALLILIVLFIAAVVFSFISGPQQCQITNTDLQQKPDQITDYDVIKHIAALHDLSEPESCGLKNGIEFRYNKANRYYSFLQDKDGIWHLVQAGYIDPPPPTIEEVQWELFILRMQLEADKRRHQEQQVDRYDNFEPFKEKPKPWVMEDEDD